MQANRGRNTRLELALGSALHRRGLRFWKHRRPIAGLRSEADFVFPRLRLAIFVDGCFWHGCPDHATWPTSNAEFWKTKIEGNRSRDKRTDSVLAKAGWTVVRFWEHQPIEEMAAAVGGVVRSARGAMTAKPSPHAS
jgi:DNA mismatch endonuclease (patch repair protein)